MKETKHIDREALKKTCNAMVAKLKDILKNDPGRPIRNARQLALSLPEVESIETDDADETYYEDEII